MSYLKVSPIYGQVDNFPLSDFCETLDEARGVIDRQEKYIGDLHTNINDLHKEINKLKKVCSEYENRCFASG